MSSIPLNLCTSSALKEMPFVWANYQAHRANYQAKSQLSFSCEDIRAFSSGGLSYFKAAPPPRNVSTGKGESPGKKWVHFFSSLSLLQKRNYDRAQAMEVIPVSDPHLPISPRWSYWKERIQENITECKRYKTVITSHTIHPEELICERTYI